MELSEFITLIDGEKLVKIGNYTIGVKRENNALFHVYLNEKNVVSYTTAIECFAFIDGIENVVKNQTQCNVTETTANK